MMPQIISIIFYEVIYFFIIDSFILFTYRDSPKVLPLLIFYWISENKLYLVAGGATLDVLVKSDRAPVPIFPPGVNLL